MVKMNGMAGFLGSVVLREDYGHRGDFHPRMGTAGLCCQTECSYRVDRFLRGLVDRWASIDSHSCKTRLGIPRRLMRYHHVRRQHVYLC